MAQLIRRYVSALPGTVETERVFSAAGQILNEFLKALTSENIAAVLFLEVNISLIGFNASVNVGI